MPFELPKLDYPKTALAPIMSEETRPSSWKTSSDLHNKS